MQSTLAAGQGSTSVETKVNCTRPLTVASGPVQAEGRVGTADGRLLGADSRVYAHGTSTCLIFALSRRLGN